MNTKINRKRVKGSVHIVAVFISAFVCIIISVLIEPIYALEMPSEIESDMSERLEKISISLLECTDELENIQVELEARIEYVEELKKEAETAESVLEMSDEQLEAVHSIISDELEKNEKSNFWPNTFNNLLFCILGAIIQPIMTWIITKIRCGEEVKGDSTKLVEI